MAGNDIPMKDFATATNGEYIYAEAADGSQVKISKSNLASLIGLDTKNLRKTLILGTNQILDLKVKGGLIVFNTTNLAEQCVALFSCYGDSSIQLLSSNTSFIIGSRTTNTANKLVLFREDSTNSCYLKNTYSVSFNIAYQIVGGFW